MKQQYTYTKYIYAQRSININITFAVKSSIRGERAFPRQKLSFSSFSLIYSSYMYWKNGSFYFSNRPLYDQQTNYFKDHINTHAYKQNKQISKQASKQTNIITNTHTHHLHHSHPHTAKHTRTYFCRQ